MNCKKRLITIIVIIFYSIINYSCEPEIEYYDVDKEVNLLMDRHSLPSVSACVIKNDEIVWSNFYGHSDLESGIRANDETIYHVASISKLIVATAIMQLVEQDLVNIEDDINNYIPISLRNPYYPNIPITARHLLTHSSGLSWPQVYEEAGKLWENFEPGQAPTLSSWIPQFLVPNGLHYNKNTWKNTKPGEFELYSNIGTNVIAYIVEQVSGENFRDYCINHIFKPLEMLNTNYNYLDLDNSNIAVLYKDNNSIISPYDERIYASGLLKTTVVDLSHFLIAYLNDGKYKDINVLEKSSINSLLELQSLTSGICLIWRARAGNWFGHLGGIEGAAATAEIQIDDGVGLIIFTNKHNSVIYPGHEIYGLIRQKANSFRD